MRLAHLNLFSAFLSLAGSVLWLLSGNVVSGLIWAAASMVWFAIAIYRGREPRIEPHPASRIGRKLSRLLIWS